ncbi:protein phosphatase 2C [Nitzschia inconspicua]|uniref:Protein phosphatase 2C n=1 Tax=Nitzschia inconspicua TaxID=303405 RepID=A0A9K3KB60_9STRA|nr:protein phosphatase 2C [Nitzschia inconspicua]
MGCVSSSEAAIIGDKQQQQQQSPQRRQKQPSGFTERKGPDVLQQQQQTIISVVDPKTTTTQTLRLGDTLHVRYACVSKRGRDPDSLLKPNQDSYSHHGTFHNDETAFFGVYDGHGPTGQDCSTYVQQQLPQMIRSALEEQYSLNTNLIEDSLKQAHIQCNRALHADSDIDDSYSGTTCVSILLQPNRVTVSNVGDSRVILGTQQQKQPQLQKWTAVPLSNDQTPRRQDEAKRCQQAGARIMSFGQLQKESRQQQQQQQQHDYDGYDEDEDDDVEDPPRIWAPNGKYPGTAFTRSIGDRMAKQFGVCAEPEVLHVTLSDKERVLVLASDGIWDVLSNQEVIDICYQHRRDPLSACHEIVKRSQEEWLKNDQVSSQDDPLASYDDMTVLVVLLGDDDKDDDQQQQQQQRYNDNYEKEDNTQEVKDHSTDNDDDNNNMASTRNDNDEDVKDHPDNDTTTPPPTTETATAAATTTTTTTTPIPTEHKRRVRQKTLRKLEEGPDPDTTAATSTFFAPTSSSSSSPVKSTTSSSHPTD